MAGDTQKEQEVIYDFKSACAHLDISSSDSITSLTRVLDAIAVELGGSEDLRTRVGAEDLFLWKDIKKLWRDLVRAQLTFWDGDDEEGEIEESKQAALKMMCAALARFTRNLVAGVFVNQQRAFDTEPDVRRMLHYYTSWTSAEDPDATLVARILTQALSNMVTGNEPLMSKLWDMYMNLPEDQVILIRLLGSTDGRTLLAVMILIRNCIQGSKTRTKMLSKSGIGSRICVGLLDNMVTLYDAEEDSEGAKAFDVGYEIFTHLMESGLVPDLYSRLSMKGEVVTPHQTTLLKLVDSYLQANHDTVEPSRQTTKARMKLCPLLSRTFFSLSSHAQQSIRRALGDNQSSGDAQRSPVEPLVELDLMLPKVCEALVLITQSISMILLDAEETAEKPESTVTSPNAESNPKIYFNDKRVEDRGLVESVIELLRLLDLFLPRINFGRPVDVAAKDSQAHEDEAQPPFTISNDGFSYLKRDLVRLLGILVHEAKDVQDRVRQCGGIEVVMNLCVIDERNPYLREHAIFTLRNLLKNNHQNQALVGEVKPMGEWDPTTGLLQDKPGVVRK